ncbi:hypothetical protein FISHEDRAFT_48384 [Fistulina hepatica ATCC 64428]|uniref:Zn(2)-C6 fungal-type domain-containing protein n=1 Tax=Fistulina hepatica ATCC 64428 TaxID=1128425 RepID=A0A0D7A592_9AGAR|nr:hypothetical protein FISHEDRAFT_48384 [Fistulina hepatica ATCC 64428]
MPEDSPLSTVPRPKAASSSQQRSSAGSIRGRASPGAESSADGRPPTKRARKAINCEPCRNSKLKCDRNRPCSSCVLRGTVVFIVCIAAHGYRIHPIF